MKIPNCVTALLACLGMIALLAAPLARADDFVIDDFNMDVILGTVSLQDPGGHVLQTFNDLWVSTQPSTDLAAYIASNPVVPTGIQNLMGSLAISENIWTFLDGPRPAPVLLDVADNIITESLPGSISGELAIVANDLASVRLAPVTSSDTSMVSEATHEFDLLNPDPNGLPNEIDSVIHFNFWVDSVVETAATPEPSTLMVLSVGILVLGFFRYVGRQSDR